MLGHSDGKAPFPLPYILVFAGYTFILIIDRVMFDSHALFEHGDEESHGHHKEGEGPAITKVPSINNRATDNLR